ncbi:adenosylcobinamide-GDP ribazoletransferase [Octadecabacter sp. R77987]|uniref:adenosylcobinamide-GDP ribazoletransferase n=1 Tax=Octadecabacter sp. R77987 TaxID=3093874 RepID=UPI00367018F9
MRNADISQVRPLIVAQDVPAALGLLTRLPLRIDTDRATARGAAAAWAFPLAGMAVAVIASVIGAVALWVGMPLMIAAGLILAAQIIITGAMHEDGLADAADGLWGGWDVARRLAIMKDSAIGTYGVLALGLSLLLRWGALVAVLSAGYLWAPLIVVAAVSRAPMVAMMAALPNARANGLSQSVGRPSGATAALAGLIALAIAVVFLPRSAFGVLLVVALVGIACAMIAMAKIKGQTGDILGATQQICEIAALAVLAAQLG